MENKVEVGKWYNWCNTNNHVRVLNIVKNRVYYEFSDGYKSDDDIDDFSLSASLSTTLNSEVGTAGFLEDIKEESSITPSHYNDKSITPLQVIDSWNLDFYLGNTIKYIARYKDKGKPLEDLKKSLNYLQLFIIKLEQDVK